MENLPVENLQFQDKSHLYNLNENDMQVEQDSPEIAFPRQIKKDNSRMIYKKLQQQIDSDFLFLQNSQDKVDSFRLIHDLKECYTNPIILNDPYISDNLPVDEILFDLLLNELMMKNDFEFLLNIIDLFCLLINVYQDSIISILLQPEFIQSILSLFNESLSLDIKNIAFQFLFQVLNFSKKSIDLSTLYFDDLYQIVFEEIQTIEENDDKSVIDFFLKYIDMLACFLPQFICSKATEIEQFVDYIFQRDDMNLFFKPMIDIFILLIDSCFDTFGPLLPCTQALSIIIDNWENEQNTSFQSLNLRFVEKVASHKIQFEKIQTFSSDSILYQICNFVSQYWEKSSINEIIKLSLKATISLIENYDESISIFIDNQALIAMISLYQSDIPFEIKKLAAIVVFHIIFFDFDIVNNDNLDDIHDIFDDLCDTNIVCPEIIDALQQRFDEY